MNLSKVNTQFVSSDFKVDLTTGEAYISQRKAAELLGIARSTFNDWVRSNSDALNLNENKQLDSKSFVKAVIFGRAKGSKKAENINDQLLEAGTKAFLYYHAGVSLAVPKPDRLHEPCVPVRWLAQQIGRSRASVNRTLNASILRLRAFKVSEEIQFVNGERCVSPALILCSAFTGKNMQAARGLLLELTETDALPPTDVLLKLATLPTN